MPGRDGTGPMGQGAMTGGGFGPCGSGRGTGRSFFGRGAFFCRGGGRGMGTGMQGGGRGFRHWFRATGLTRWMRGSAPFLGAASNTETEKEYLKQEAEVLQAEMDALKKRMAELETASKKD